MKHIVLLFFFLICSLASAQIVNIPDANFKDRLIFNGFDTNNDGEIQVSEAEAVIFLTVSYEDITDLSGIEAFINIRKLDIRGNQVSTINLSNNVALEDLNVSNNPISVLNLDTNSALTKIIAPNCELESLILTNHPLLNTLVVQLNQITNLDVSGAPAITFFRANNNLLTSIDLSNNTLLSQIYLSDNQITSLDVNSNSNLEDLIIDNNQLTAINVTGTTALRQLSVNDNQISSLNLSTSTNLYSLSANYNSLTSIDLSNHPDIQYINVKNNQLTSLMIGDDNAIEYIDCSYNLFTALDFSNLNTFIFASQPYDISNNPNLMYINLKSGQNYVHTDAGNTGNFNSLPSLEVICMDDANSTFASNVQFLTSENIVITEYCSFVPGGDYNTITGNITYDSDNNGCDTNDTDFPFVRINIDDGAETGASYTNSDGEYAFYTQDGNFTITPSLENPSFFNVTPINATINFPNNNNNIQIEDFCITANGIHNDVEIVIAPIFPARPGFDAQYLLTYKNKGNQTLSGNLSFQYDDTVLDFVTSTQMTTSQTVGQLTWDYSNLMPFESRSIYVTLSVNAPTDTPAVNIDDELNFTATVNPIAGDDLPNDNVFNFNQTVVGAFDPNNIICIEGDVVAPSEIGSFLHYVVNFENTGNAPAENIVIEIEIDPTQYDINALYLLSSSHNAEVSIADNIVKIIFQSIYLASGGHGNILLKIPTQLSLQPQDFVTKNADIFFDYNFPIETNNAQTTFATLSNPEFGGDRSITMYPNPTKDNIYITADNPIKSIELYDMQGRIVKQEKYNKRQVNVNIANQALGIYFIKISTEKGVNTEKIIKM